MKINSHLLCALLMSVYGSVLAMEPDNKFSEFQVFDFNPERDMIDIYPMWQQDWDKLFMGKPYSPSIVDALMAPKSDESEEIKKTKVLRHIQKTIAFTNYYKRHATNDVYLDTGAVVKEYQHQGIGKYFMPVLLKDAKAMGVHTVLIDVSKDNPAMLALCKRYGFETFGTTLRDKAWALKLVLKDQ